MSNRTRNDETDPQTAFPTICSTHRKTNKLPFDLINAITYKDKTPNKNAKKFLQVAAKKAFSELKMRMRSTATNFRFSRDISHLQTTQPIFAADTKVMYEMME